MSDKVISVDINLNIRPSLTLLKKLAESLFEYLLFSRQQIPFQFEIFKKFTEAKAIQSEVTANWKTEKQLKAAFETYQKICAVKKIFETNFDGSAIQLIFGNTIHTAKESFQIQFPSINELIHPTFVNEATAVMKILLTLIQNDELKDKQQLPITNVFILFKLPKQLDEEANLIELRNFKLPRSCRERLIRIRDSSDFKIFEEFQDISLSEKPSAKDDDDEIWYQSKIFVKGFKDVLVDGQSIWK